MERRQYFQQIALATTGHSLTKKKKKKKEKSRIYQNNSNYVSDLNEKHKNYKLLGDNIGENLDNLGFGNDLLDTMPKA